MKIYFVRHGETDWNKERKIQGQVDIPLNAFGVHLAEETGKGLADVKFDVCFTSPLGRAKETARLILKENKHGNDVPVFEDARIEEMAFGEYEGRCCARENWDLPESFQKFFDDPEHFVPAEGGESFEQVKKRTGEFVCALFSDERYQDQNVLVTTHGAALAGILNNIKEGSLAEYWGTGVHKNCAVTEVKVTNGKAELLSENKTYYEDEVKPW